MSIILTKDNAEKILQKLPVQLKIQELIQLTAIIEEDPAIFPPLPSHPKVSGEEVHELMRKIRSTKWEKPLTKLENELINGIDHAADRYGKETEYSTFVYCNDILNKCFADCYEWEHHKEYGEYPPDTSSEEYKKRHGGRDYFILPCDCACHAYTEVHDAVDSLRNKISKIDADSAFVKEFAAFTRHKLAQRIRIPFNRNTLQKYSYLDYILRNQVVDKRKNCEYFNRITNC